MRQQAIEAMASALKDYDYDGIGIEPSIATITYYLDEASDALDALLVFLTEHADEWMVEAGREWCDYSHWISEPEDLLAVLSADREDAE